MNICLTAIVRDSGELIRRTLQSFLPYIDYFCICDTGSTDNTLQVLLEETTSYEGSIFQCPFSDFSHNRNVVLEEAESRFPGCYYVMVDDSFLLENGHGFRQTVRHGKEPAYSVIIENEETASASVRIVRKGLRYRYRVHERIVVDDAPILQGFRFVELRTPEHRLRTARRASSDLEKLHYDLVEYPDDPRLLYYIARAMYDRGEKEEAGKWFMRRIVAQRKGACPVECYQSMMYIVLLAEHRNADPLELVQLYTGIHKRYPQYAEPLYFAAMSLMDVRRTEEGIGLLERAFEIPFQAQLGAKRSVYALIPKTLCGAYFRSDKEKCVSWLYRNYTTGEKPFDFLYESYLRHLHRFVPLIPFFVPVIVYRHHLTKEELHEVLSFQTVSFSEEELRSYRDVVSNYSIQHVVVLDRVDRIPFFPNVGGVHLIVRSEGLQGGLLEPFRSLQAVVGRDAEHVERIKGSYLTHRTQSLAFTMERWKEVFRF